MSTQTVWNNPLFNSGSTAPGVGSPGGDFASIQLNDGADHLAGLPLGTVGQVLISAGADTSPVWGTAGTSTDVSVTETGTAASFYPTFISGHTSGTYVLGADAGISYNPSTNVLTATTFVGNLTGNASGTAATVTGAAQAAITSVGTLTGLTVNGLLGLGSYAKASLPTATATGQMIYVNDSTNAVGTGAPCYWNSADWINVTTGVAVV